MTTFDGPVPAEWQALTGATTWSELVAWMNQQMNAAGLSSDFAGSLAINVDSTTGQITSLQVLPEGQPVQIPIEKSSPTPEAPPSPASPPADEPPTPEGINPT